MHGHIIDFAQGAQTFSMSGMTVGQQDMLQLVVIGFDEVDKLKIHMARVDEQGLGSVFGRHQIGIAKADHTEVLVDVQWRASS